MSAAHPHALALRAEAPATDLARGDPLTVPTGEVGLVRREGDGDDAKVVVSFQRHGLKKLVEKYAGLKKA